MRKGIIPQYYEKIEIIMQEFISDWFIPMDFGNDMPDEEPDGEDNFNFD